jgi:hypothetical protein
VAITLYSDPKHKLAFHQGDRSLKWKHALVSAILLLSASLVTGCAVAGQDTGNGSVPSPIRKAGKVPQEYTTINATIVALPSANIGINTPAVVIHNPAVSACSTSLDYVAISPRTTDNASITGQVVSACSTAILGRIAVPSHNTDTPAPATPAVVKVSPPIVEPTQPAPAPKYSLNASVSPTRTGSVTPAIGSYESGVKVTLAASPVSGYVFDFWDGDTSGSSPTVTVTMDSNKNIVAHFKPSMYSLNVSVVPSAAGFVNATNSSYVSGAQVTLNASPAKGYIFDYWDGDATGNTSTVTVVMNSNKNITAHFKVTAYSLTVTVSPARTGSVSPASGTYAVGTKVTITASPVSGYIFDYWDGDASGTSSTITIIMDANKVVTARFIPIPALAPTPAPTPGTPAQGAAR